MVLLFLLSFPKGGPERGLPNVRAMDIRIVVVIRWHE